MQDYSSETAVLGSALISRETFEKVCNCLRREDFAKEEHRLIFDKMASLFNAGKPCDTVTLIDELGYLHTNNTDGLVYITELAIAVPSAANVQHYIESVLTQSRQRQFVEGMQSILNALEVDPETDYAVQAQSLIDAVQGSGSGTVASVSAEDVAKSILSIGKVEDNIPTGFLTLDTTIGGLKRGHLTVIGARPSVGKTSFAMNIAQSAAMSGRVVIVFSLEMPVNDVLQRAAISLSKCSTYDYEAGNAAKVDKLFAAGEALSKTKLYLFDNVYTLEEIRAKCYNVRHQAKGIDLVIIDYLGLIQTVQRKNGTREQEVAELSRGLKRMAKTLNTPVVLLSQLSRASEGRKDHIPMLADLRESGAIEQDADEVLFLYRPILYDKTAEPTEALIIVAKNRGGKTGDVAAKWEGEYFTFEDVAFIEMDEQRSWEDLTQ